MSTASALERELECPASAALGPVVHESGEDAQRGNAIHRFCRSIIVGTPRSVALALVPEGQWRETCEQIDVNVLGHGLTKIRAEVAYRITAHEDAEDTVVQLGINLDRRYPPRGPNDIDGTSDIEGQEPITKLWTVLDLKTGFMPVTACRENPQMRFHARALMLMHNVDRVKARIVYIAVDGRFSFDDHTFTRLELDVFADDLLARKAKIARANEAIKAGERFDVFAGSWCRWCTAQTACPKNTALAYAMLPALHGVHDKWGELTPEQRGEAFMMAYEAQDLSTRIVESMKSLARIEPITLPQGKVLRETGSGVRVVNGPRASRSRRVA
jgi:hypothetical protein